MNAGKPVLGLATADFFNSYQRAIWTGINHEIKEHDLRILCFLGGALDVDIEIYSNRNDVFNLINKNNIDVLLLMAGSIGFYAGQKGIKNFLKKIPGIPVVSIAYNLAGIPSIVIDNFGGMYKVVDHLITAHNCRKLAFIKGPDANEEACMRHDAYKKCLADHDIPYDKNLICQGQFWHTDGELAIRTLIDERKVTFDALVGSDDHGIFFSIPHFQKRGFNIPEDIKITGFDDMEKSQYANPPLTTVKQPLFELGVVAVQMALKILNDEIIPDLIEIDTHLIIRESCGCTESKLPEHLSSPSNNTEEKKTIPFDSIFTTIEKKIRGLYYENLVKSKMEGYIKDNIMKIIRMVVSSLTDFKREKILNNLELVLQKTFDKGFNTSFWMNILKTIINELLTLNLSTDKIQILDTIQSNATAIFYKTETRLQAFKRINQFEFDQFLIRIGDKMSTSSDINTMKKILRSELPSIWIKHCIISLYQEDKSKSLIIFYYGPEDHNKYEYKEFNTTDIFPDEIRDGNNRSYVILPLVTEATKLGFIAFETADIPQITFEHLAEKISRGLKNIKTMEKINHHTFELEKHVIERTKELEMTVEQLKEQSFRDQLTGLKNRRYLMEVILPETQEFIHDFVTYKKDDLSARKCFAIFLLDLDYFKDVNDTYGHTAGDLILVQISQIFNSLARKNDALIRMGGEEFLLIFKNFDKSYLPLIAEKIRYTIAEHKFFLPNDSHIHKTCSIGCATYPLNYNHPDTIEFLTAVSLADKALYYAKENGRNLSAIIELHEKFFYNTGMIDRVFNSFNECIDEGIVTVKKGKSLIEYNPDDLIE